MILLMLSKVMAFNCFWQVDRGLDLVDEMQQRGLTLSPPTFNPFIRDFARWGMPDEVQVQANSYIHYILKQRI